MPAAMAANPQIKLTTNRYIILDDPNKNYLSVTANAETGFGLPGSWSTDAWKGESTTIRGVALVLNADGTPASGVTVTFSVLDWNDATPRNPLKSDTNSKTNVTNDYGLATVPFDLNNEQQYGRWKITATATVAGTSVSSTSNFVYNWWGCQNCHGSPYSGSGSSKSYTSKIGTNNRYDPYSPYITGRDFHATMYRGDHVAGTGNGLNEGECWACHNSYDKDLNLGQEKTDNGASYAGKGVPSTYGVHTNLACAECHSIIGTSSNGIDQTVKSCDSTGCHVGATDYNSHIGPETVTATSPNKYVNYSGLDATLGIRSFGTPSYIPTPATFNSNPLTGARAHTSATVQNIPCTVCHGPMHNVTKPNINTVPKNTITEDTQCTTCHQSLKHSNNNPVYCTACHSQDAHNITVLSKTATSQPSYVFLGSTNAMTNLTTDCEQCHASGPEATFFGSLTTADSAAYSTNFAPATPVHNRHNGTVACTVCHDNTNFHDIKFLQPNGAYSTSKTTAVKCIDCHDGTNSAVRSVVQTRFGSLPPTVNANMNHSSDNGGQKWGNYWTTPNGACLYCHGETQHNTSAIGAAGSALGTDKVGDPIGSGTVCSSCHNQDDSNYNVVNSLSPKPPANKAGSNYPSSGAVDHSSFGITDNDCKNCHGSNLAGGENMVGFTHNVAPSGGSGSCDSCHAQPPNGASRYNTQGAHTLHSAAGYGNIAITGCNYCHSTEGANEAGHPGTFNDATVVTNSSATIALYTPNILNGQDDTCAGVSCHTTGLS
ncbi:MAG: cytochrome c3 family protein, partial [Candidatus Methanoperedens sp.]